ncbi:MAG TPA: type II secretion system F family protein [Phototrophicaceae bacterium]|jgi:type II secretory pathway component PulF|nr:type II secretion system F family protein [Phototrophicaceae bacterium]
MNHNHRQSNPHPHSLITSERLYQMLLIAYPASFRHEYANDLTQVFRDSYRDALQSGGIRSALQVWLHTLVDLVTTASVQRYEHLQNRFKEPSNTMPYTPFDYQLGSTVKSLTVLLRNGYSVFQSFDLLAQQSPEPTASQFRSLLDDVQNGTPLLDALTQLQSRVSSQHFTAVIDTMIQQFQEGGNLADRLDPVAQTIYQTVGDDAQAQAALNHFRSMTNAN